jgi:hypothetical protein
MLESPALRRSGVATLVVLSLSAFGCGSTGHQVNVDASGAGGGHLGVGGAGGSQTADAARGDAVDAVIDRSSDGGVGDGADSAPDAAPDSAPDAAPDTAPDLGGDAPPGRCISRKPDRALISDFISLDNSAFGVSPRDELVGQVGATGNLQIDFSNAEWRTTGSVAQGRVEQLDINWTCEDISDLCPLDASAYAGIQFTIRSNAGSVQAADFRVHTIEDDTVEMTIQCGRCIEAPGTLFPTACLAPRVNFPITRAPTVVTLRWTDFSGGLPTPSVTPSQITTMYIVVHEPPPSDGGAGTYDIDLTIDDIRFIPF